MAHGASDHLFIPWGELARGELLGAGGQGAVFRGTWTPRRGAARDVALKRLDADLGALGSAERARGALLDGVRELKRHCAAAMRCGERVCRIDGVSVDDAEVRIYLVMPLMAGGSLAGRIEAGMAEAERLAVAADVLEGMAELHRCGVVHCDIKPHNVLLDGAGRACLCDFGLAQWAQQSMRTQLRTQGGAGGRGTDNYMSPEQWDDELGETGAPADVWCAAATLSHLWTGRVPFAGKSHRQIMRAVCDRGEHPAVPGGEGEGAVPEPLRGVMLRAFSLEPAGRPTAAEMLAAARECVRAAAAGGDGGGGAAAGATRPCAVCGEDEPEAEAAGCEGGAGERHWACRACLEAWLASQEERLGDVFAAHGGNFPCGGLGTGCAGSFPREGLVPLLSPEWVGAFLRGLEAAARKKERAEVDAEFEALRRRLAEKDDPVVRHLLALQELQNDCCPGCGGAFLDFDGCFVLNCHRDVCRRGDVARKFCGWCLADLGHDNAGAHAHVRGCARSLTPGNYYGSPGDWERATAQRKRERTEGYLARECGGRGVRDRVLREGAAWLPEGLAGGAEVEERRRVLGEAGASGTLDLGGATVDLARPLEVRAGGAKTVRNGTLRWTGGDKGGLGNEGGYGVFVEGAGARLVLEGVTVVGTGVNVEGGGHARLARCAVRDAPRAGVVALGQGSRVEVEGGSVSGSKEGSGISAEQGGHAVVKGVQVEDNKLWVRVRVRVRVE